ncbi:MAG: hypothetical protein IPN08_00225 [Bacteroidales bacterium]|nr:hypothetical protein [Bacteroidales bacterium]
MKKIFCLLLCISLSAANTSTAQQSLWTAVGADQGLPDPNVTALVRVPGGKLFVGTAIGLFSFDGYTFCKVGLSGNRKINPYINCLTTDGESVFVGGRDALVRLNPATGQSEIIYNPMSCIGGIMDLYFNHDKSKLYARTHCGVMIVNIEQDSFRLIGSIKNPAPRKFRIVSDDEIHGFVIRNKFISIHKHIETVLFTDTGMLDAYWWEKEQAWLVVKQDGLYLLDGQYKSLNKLKFQVEIKPNENRWLYPDQNGGFWIQASGKFAFLRSARDQSPEFFENEPGNPFSFTSNTSQAFFTEPDGTRWVGGDGTGLCYQLPVGGKIRFLTNEQSGVQHFWCFRYEKETHKLLCGTTAGIAEGVLENGEFRNRNIHRPAGFDRFSVNSVVELNKEEYLISVYREGFWTFNKQSGKFSVLSGINKQIGTQFVFGIGEASGNRLILCTQFSAYLLDKKTMNLTRFVQPAFHNYSIYSAIEDSRGRFLMAGGFGLQIFNQDLKQIRYFTASNSLGSTLPSNVIFDLAELGADKYLIATMGGGLCLFNFNDSTFRPLKLATDPDNIFGIMPAGNNTFILTTSNGLCRFNIKTGESAMLNKTNVLPFNDFNQQAFFHDENYTLAGGEKGMLILRSEDLNNVFSVSSEIIIRKGEKKVNSLELNSDEHSLHLQLSLDRVLPIEKREFRYRIPGIDQAWQSLPLGQNTLVYNYLPPGDYILEIELNDETGLYKTLKRSVLLTIKPHFFQTWWFRALLLLLIAGAMFLLVRYFMLLRLRWKLNRLDAERKIMLERSRISRELHDNLGSQLTYLISGLETTGLLLKRNNLEKTSGNLDKLQSAARESMQQLRDSIWALNPGTMTLQSLIIQYEKWVSRVAEPYENLQCTFQIEKLPDIHIDPLNGLNLFRIMQEAVNNALKHSGANKLLTSLHAEAGIIRIEISDNGKGFAEGGNEGTGMSSMKQRAETIRARLAIESAENNGTTVSVIIEKNTLSGL